MGRVLLVVASAFLITALGTGLAAGQVNLQSEAEAASSSSSDVFMIGTQTAVRPGSSTLTRSVGGISLTINTSRLTPNAAHTLWWVVFNQPHRCATLPCSASDFPGNGGNPAINVSLFWATGSVADANGLATFAAHTAPGEIEGEVGFGAGLTNPLGAEVHVIIRDHGLVNDLLGQLIQLNACNPTCKNVQTVIHLH